MDWVVRKGGYFYRPNAAGYTSDILQAGFYDERSAKAHAHDCEGVTAHPVSEFSTIIDASIADTQKYLDRLKKVRAALPQ